MWTFWKLLPALLAAPSAAQRVLELSSVGWTATNGVNATVKTNFPTQIHLDLYQEGIIGDPLYDYNDVNQLWVANSNWTFTSSPLLGL
jgi:beta-mannosidase